MPPQDNPQDQSSSYNPQPSYASDPSMPPAPAPSTDYTPPAEPAAPAAPAFQPETPMAAPQDFSSPMPTPAPEPPNTFNDNMPSSGPVVG